MRPGFGASMRAAEALDQGYPHPASLFVALHRMLPRAAQVRLEGETSRILRAMGILRSSVPKGPFLEHLK